MALNLGKPLLSGENSILASLASVALVVGVYNASVGPVADVHATPAGDLDVRSSLSKAGWISLATVAGVALLAKDMNIVICGGAAIIAEEFAYRHAHMSAPGTGKLAQITPAAYAPAGGVAVPAAG